MRLENGESIEEGRLEIYFSGTWRTVCGFQHWDSSAAAVACRQLGHPFATAQAINNPTHTIDEPYFGAGSEQIWPREVHCKGDETRLESCPRVKLGENLCSHNQDAGVICRGIVIDLKRILPQGHYRT